MRIYPLLWNVLSVPCVVEYFGQGKRLRGKLKAAYEMSLWLKEKVSEKHNKGTTFSLYRWRDE